MVDYQISTTNFTTPFLGNSLHLRDVALNASGDESVFPASTLSAHSDYDSSSDVTSLLLTARSASPTNLVEENYNSLSVGHTGERGSSVGLKNNTMAGSPKNLDLTVASHPTNLFLEQSNTMFMPILAETAHTQRSRAPSPGISKMLLSLSDHPVERPCTPTASTLYRNTKTHCNPSELGQQTYDECMMFTRWANTLLQQSQDQFFITDLVRDLGDGLTLLSMVEMLVGECPPQIHIKPALDVQKMENVQTCLDFLEYYDVSVNGITAEDIVKGNLKVVLALCHCLYRHFASSAGTPGSKRVKREINRLHLREQRLKERHGSQLSYLEEASQGESRISREKLQLSFENPSRILSDNERQKVGGFMRVSLVPKDTAENGTSSSTKRELGKLEEELRLLQLECGDESFGVSTPSFRASHLQRSQKNPRQELRDLCRGSLVGTKVQEPKLSTIAQETFGNNDLVAASRCKTFQCESDDGKLPFGGCYLSEPAGEYKNSKTPDLEHSLDESFIFKEYPAQPSFLEEIRALTPRTSSQAVLNGQGANVFKSSMKSQGISNLFDVDFGDLDARMSRDQENTALKRMVRVASRSKLDRRSRQSASSVAVNVNGEMARSLLNSSTEQDKGQQLGTGDRRSRHGLNTALYASFGVVNVNGEADGEAAKSLLSSSSEENKREKLDTMDSRSVPDLGTGLSASLSQANVNGESAKLFGSSTKLDKEEQLGLPLSFVPLNKPMFKDKGSSLSTETPLETFSSEPKRPHLQRSFSKEKRHREQVFAKKSARNALPSSSKAHLHNLTALIRTSAKNANASCSEEEQ